MAWIKPKEDEKDKQKEDQDVVVSSPSTVISGQGNQPQEPKTDSRSGMFTNLNSYLEANKDQADQFSSAVLGQAQSDLQRVQNKAGAEAQMRKMDIGNQNLNTTVNNQLLDRTPSKIGDWNEQSEEWSDLKKILEGGFDPRLNDFNYSPETSSELKNASDTAKKAKESGVQQGLQDRYYNDRGQILKAGERNFDNVLLQRNKLGQGLASDLGVLSDKYLGEREADLAGTNELAKKMAEENKTYAGTAKTNLGAAYDLGLKGVNTKVGEANVARGKETEAKQKELNKIVDSVQDFGGVAGLVDPMKGYGGAEVLGKDYVTHNPNVAWQNVIDEADRKRYAGLFKLLGLSEDGDKQDFVEPLSAAEPAYKFNEAGYKDILAAEEGKKTAAINDILAKSKIADEGVLDLVSKANSKRAQDYKDASKDVASIDSLMGASAVGPQQKIVGSAVDMFGKKIPVIKTLQELPEIPLYSGANIAKGNYMKYGGDLGWSNVISPEQQQQLNALDNLVRYYKGDPGATYESSLQNSPDLYSFDEAGYQKAIADERVKRKDVEDKIAERNRILGEWAQINEVPFDPKMEEEPVEQKITQVVPGIAENAVNKLDAKEMIKTPLDTAVDLSKNVAEHSVKPFSDLAEYLGNKDDKVINTAIDVADKVRTGYDNAVAPVKETVNKAGEDVNVTVNKGAEDFKDFIKNAFGGNKPRNTENSVYEGEYINPGQPQAPVYIPEPIPPPPLPPQPEEEPRNFSSYWDSGWY